MAHKCFISFKNYDKKYRDTLVELFTSNGVDVIDKSLDRVIDSGDADYIMYVIRRDYLADSTVTVFLIGEHSSENEGNDWLGNPKNYYIQRELQASLFNGVGNSRSGVVGVVLPSMYDKIYKGSYKCSNCGKEHNGVNINDATVIREFSANYYLEPHDGCGWDEEQRYCVLVKWDDFIRTPECFIEKAFEKRNSDVAKRVKVRNFR